MKIQAHLLTPLKGDSETMSRHVKLCPTRHLAALPLVVGFLTQFLFRARSQLPFYREVFFSVNFSGDNCYFSRLVKLCPTRRWSSFLPCGRFCSGCEPVAAVGGSRVFVSTFLSTHRFHASSRLWEKSNKMHECNVFSHNISSLIPTLLRTFPKSAQLEYQEL